jgi:hypothetical protein
MRSPRHVVLATMVMVCAGLMLAFPAEASADSTTPTLTLIPATGPAGTHVTITGHLSAAQLPVWAPILKAPEIFTLLTDISASCAPNATSRCTPGPTSLAGCELLDGAVDGVIHVNDSTGVVTGSFIVDGRGTCVQSDPDAATHSAPPGKYALSIGCPACEIGEFTLTAPSSEPTLPATGFSAALASLGGGILVAVGLLLYSYARWRNRRFASSSSSRVRAAIRASARRPEIRWPH